MKDYHVYMYIRSKDSKNGFVGTPYYVGKGKNNRAYAKHNNIPTPKDKSCIIIVERYLTNNTAIALERLLIRLYGRIDIGTGCLYNRTDGGEATEGWIPSEETRKKISTARKGKCYLNEAQRKAISNRTKGEKNPYFGKTHSDTVRKKMSIRQKGRPKSPFSEEHKKNMSKSCLEALERGTRVPWNKGKTGVQDYSKILRTKDGKFANRE